MQPRWARRTEGLNETNELTSALEASRHAGRPMLDLTASNPTRCRFESTSLLALDVLAQPSSRVYDAHPLGSLEARAAIAGLYYASRGSAVSPERMMLMASTSEAYAHLLRLFCEPGDDILVPSPSYPLFDLLARFNDVVLRPYPLLRQDGWTIDWHALQAMVTPRTRAIVCVHPNNPTGHFTTVQERLALDSFAARQDLALIVDEVFLDYPIESGEEESFTRNSSPAALTFVLSGISKVLALPQMKLAWTAVSGPHALVNGAMRRLEFLADTYLSVQTPVQRALPVWLPLAGTVQAELLHRCRSNLSQLDRLLARHPQITRMRVEAGWSVILRIPAIETDEHAALRLAARGVHVHPGSLYGLPGSGWLVCSLLVEPEVFASGCRIVLEAVDPASIPEPM